MDLVADEYWEQRYSQDDGVFDWFKKYDDVSFIFHREVPDKTSRILNLGCGNSTLSGDLYKDGYKNIDNVDYSPVVIDKMKALHADMPEMTWFTGDVRELSDLDDESFDVIVDKGTMDAMMTIKGDVWNPPEPVVRNCEQEMATVRRLLKPGGVFLYITFGQPHFRRQYLQREGYTLHIDELGDTFHYYAYTLRKAL